MSNLYIFRGKSATGKTLLTSLLSKELNICVLRKDDIFDPLSVYLDNNSINNKACYDILASIVQKSIDNNVDAILDISLPHNEYYKLFLSKINFKDTKVFSFLCDCSNEELWLSRWIKRLENPLPNQYFKSLEEIKNHYSKMDIALMGNECYIDSIYDAEQLLSEIYSFIELNKTI